MLAARWRGQVASPRDSSRRLERSAESWRRPRGRPLAAARSGRRRRAKRAALECRRESRTREICGQRVSCLGRCLTVECQEMLDAAGRDRLLPSWGRRREAGIGVGGVVGRRAAVQGGDGGAGRRAGERGRGRGRACRGSRCTRGWRRYREAGLAGLADRSQRPRSSPHQASAEVEARVCELRRAHPRWGAQRIVHELMRGPVAPEPLPSRATVHRILVRHGLVVGAAAAAQALGLRALGAAGGDAAVAAGHRLRADARRRRTGELREARIVTGVDDHSRFCVIARVVERATGRAICLAFARGAGALRGAGGGADRQRQAVHRPLRPRRRGAVRQDLPAQRDRAPAHRSPRSPTTTGKIERFHQTLRRELLDDARPFTSVLEAQAALDDWVREYNAERPHQALDDPRAGHPGRALPAGARGAARAAGAVAARRAWPPSRSRRASRAVERADRRRRGAARRAEGGPVEFDRVVPPSGNLWVAGRQFWLGPAGPGRPSASGPASTSSTSRSPAPASRACARTCPAADLAQLAARRRDSGRARRRCRPSNAGARDRGRPRGQQQRPRRPRRPPGARRRDPRAAAA